MRLTSTALMCNQKGCRECAMIENTQRGGQWVGVVMELEKEKV